jgi:hypothetical protein
VHVWPKNSQGAALVTNQRLLESDLTPLAFLSVDNRLNDAAAAEGLTPQNLNDHP